MEKSDSLLALYLGQLCRLSFPFILNVIFGLKLMTVILSYVLAIGSTLII